MKKSRWLVGLLVVLGVWMLPCVASAAETRFTDVTADSPYAEAIGYCVDQAWFQGTGNSKFSPNEPLTRAMFVQVLANRVENYRPEDYNQYYGIHDKAYADVSPKAWYAPAVDWGKATGLVRGVGNGRFEPERPLIREELAQLLYTYAYRTGDCGEGPAADILDRFDDVQDCGASAREALGWAVEKGLLTDYRGMLSPKAAVTRGQVALVLYRAREILESDKITILFDIDPEAVSKLKIHNGITGTVHEVIEPGVIRDVVEKLNGFRYSEGEVNRSSGWTLWIDVCGEDGEILADPVIFPEAVDFLTYRYISVAETPFPMEWMEKLLEPPMLFDFEAGNIDRVEIRDGRTGNNREASEEEAAEILKKLNGFRYRAVSPSDGTDWELAVDLIPRGGGEPVSLILRIDSLEIGGTVYESFTGNWFAQVWQNALLGREAPEFDETAERKGEALFHLDPEEVDWVAVISTGYSGGSVQYKNPEDAEEIREIVKRCNAFRYTEQTDLEPGAGGGERYAIQFWGKRLTNWWYYISDTSIEKNGVRYSGPENAPVFSEEWLAEHAFSEHTEE